MNKYKIKYKMSLESQYEILPKLNNPPELPSQPPPKYLSKRPPSPPKSLPPSKSMAPTRIQSVLKDVKNLKYGLVVVFCAGEPYIDPVTKEFHLPETEYNEKVGKEMYVGCKKRLDVAGKLGEETGTMILVGGSFEKVNTMYKYLISQGGVSSDKLYLLESYPSTMGNLWALKKLLDQMEEISEEEETFITRETKRIYFLADAWQIHRIMAFATDIISNEYQLVPLPVQAFKATSEEFISEVSYQNRMVSEFKGLLDYYQGKYEKQEKDYDYWTSKLHVHL